MNDIKQLAAQWIAAKEAERVAIEERRTVEDAIKALVEFAEDTEGTETIKPDEYIIKIAGRIDRKVDGEKVQELAAEYGLTDHLAKLFRWKPEINMAVWKSTDESITRPLAAAITAKPGRPSFSITIKE
jgi:plasmid stabilization system protein ParE